jgi:polyphosphate kinase
LIEIPTDLQSTARQSMALQSTAQGKPNRQVRRLMLSEDVVRAHVDGLFLGMPVVGVYQFRLLRGVHQPTDLPIGRHMALARQKAWPVVRIDVEEDMPDWVLRWLQENLEAPLACVLRRQAPLGIGSLAAEWAERVPEFAQIMR